MARSATCHYLLPMSGPPHNVVLVQELFITSVPLSTLRSLVRRPWPSIVLVALAFCLLWLDLFSLPASPVIPELDPSWCGALIHFSTQGLQFGKDVLFTHGPLAHLTAFVYTGELFPVRVLWEFISKALFAAILCLTMVRLPLLWRPFFFLFILLFIWADGVLDALYFLVISCLAALLFRQSNSSPTLGIFAGVLLAVFSLIKFTYFLLALFVLALTLIYYCKQRKPVRALFFGLAYVTTFLACWGLARQQYCNLLPYLTTSLDICFGYKEAMGVPAASTAIVLAGTAAMLLGMVQCGLIVLESRKLPVLLVALFFAGETFLSWGRAFVRADDHVLSFFALCPVALLPMWIVVQPRTKVRYAGYAINFLLFVTCLLGISLQRPMALTTCVNDAARRFQRTWNVVTGLRIAAEQLHARLEKAKSDYALPRVQAEVRNQTIDVFGYEQGIALLNNLNYTPRPVLQGYSAYTPSLINANTAFYSGSQAPAYVLFKYQSIDDRYPTLEDAGVLKQLLFDYKPLFEEQNYSLWKRIRPAKPIQPLDTVTESLSFDSEYAIPAGKMLWLQLNIGKSLPGRALNLFYKPPIVTILITDSRGRQTSHRLIPSMSSTGFLINPSLNTARQVLRVAGGAQNSSAVSFSVHVSKEGRRFFQREIVSRLTCAARAT